LTLWQCAAKVILAFLIFAVLVLRVNDSRPYTPFQTVKFFILILLSVDSVMHLCLFCYRRIVNLRWWWCGARQKRCMYFV